MQQGSQNRSRTLQLRLIVFSDPELARLRIGRASAFRNAKDGELRDTGLDAGRMAEFDEAGAGR